MNKCARSQPHVSQEVFAHPPHLDKCCKHVELVKR